MSLHKQLIEWRRDFHRHPELGFLEMRTSTIVADTLVKLGYDIKIGRQVMNPDFTMGKPSDEETKAHYEWAKENGAVLEYLDQVSEGYTGIVATLDTGREGPTAAFRVDMDALPIYESEDSSHVPLKEGFRSVNNEMHACGHDVHTSIGLGLATLLMEHKDTINGTIKLLFQPAEEGTRGARSMVEAGVVDDVDYFVASHIGTGVPYNHFLASNNGFLATSKIDVTFKGVSSHAGGQPEEGKNAMLAAANAVINLNAIPRHSGGATRINVGELHAGSGRNVIAGSANLKIETRGTTAELNDYMKQYAESIIKGAAQMFQVESTMETVGEGTSAKGSTALAEVLVKAADSASLTTSLEENKPSGSEDATFFINRVQERGGLASYCIFGTDLAAGHHNEKFDINEDSMAPAVQTLLTAAQLLTNEF
ncbi:Indole-3-acetyl-aspartic acid hydrolase [Jeotgalicoccus aerolatus]|uniref:Aminobenzoyl-glutamate utilization protein A n=1 Tax=Jeotgalicoccus aerolatus TaxID=709510 RepID=A0A1G8XAW1_9STAP|nr:amidohydrolase [Jeotgalicoccus aerolatus]MBP1952362.1 aminobenzoyl-glutamate utilization protein A [Jeotgalicoccus aerolatus]NMA80429.1 M20 family metallo-hydrolase [Jeotgalicoccus aerolatus]CAD2072735.1 Indole-3-acetyl-aspartic acid hydrolase [Jeotgalicoccus aerolatus]SDJ87631.1 aminobenzoyl-glutamate utilization protein A [Jeotgalicoccus aerolatus]GGE03638.1 peptidase M20 [Jeotgalicoccus aerolatus]